MDRQGHNNVNFFIGTEVEHTPAYGKRTLFVVGVHSSAKIIELYHTHRCEHIYFGANQCYNGTNLNGYEHMIVNCLNAEILCTFDFDVKYSEAITESILIEYDNFIPMVSVKIPYARLFNYNTTIKIDDTDFKHSNPGVWCHQLHDLMDRKKYTDWSQYTQDETLND